MLKYDNDEIIIYYEESDNYINDLIDYLLNKIDMIKKFLKIKKVDRKPIVYLVNNKKAFDDLFMKENGFKCDNNAIGFVTDKIYCLSYNDYKNTTHYSEKIKFFYNIIVHELTHYYLNIIIENRPMRFLNEGLALYFGNQYKFDKNKTLKCSIEDLKQEKNIDYYNYYLIMNYLIKRYSHELLLKMLINRETATKIIDKIYNECMNYYKKGE